MKPILLKGLNPLNPAHYLVSLGALALASRCEDASRAGKATLEWPAAPDSPSGAVPFRPLLRIADWSTKAIRDSFRAACSPSPYWPGDASGLEDVAEGGSGLLDGQFDRAIATLQDPNSVDGAILVAVVTDQAPATVKKKAKERGLDIQALPTGRATDADVQAAVSSLINREPSASPVVVFGKAGVIAKIENVIKEVDELRCVRTVRVEPLGTGPLMHELALRTLSCAPPIASAEAACLTWLSSGRLAKNCNAEATTWLFGKKAGLLRPLRDTIRPLKSTERFRRFRKVLAGPAWPYTTYGPMLGVDSDTVTDGARSIRNTDGTSPSQCLEALRLIGEALPLFTVGSGGRVAGISRAAAMQALPALAKEDRYAEAFLYPLWSPPLALSEIRLIFNYPWHQLLRSPGRLRTMGVWAILAAPCLRKGATGDRTEKQLGRAVRVV